MTAKYICIHDGVKYVDYGEGPKTLDIIKQPSFDYDPSVRRISDESLTCISKILRGRGTEGCGYVMDEDGYMDLEDLGLALRKELRHPIPWNIQNIMEFFKLDKKQRFIGLGCPDASRRRPMFSLAFQAEGLSRPRGLGSRSTTPASRRSGT